MNIIIGLVIGIGGILFGNFLEGGHLSSLIQLTAAFIVFGGTLGAVIVSNSTADIKMGLSSISGLFKSDKENSRQAIYKSVVESAKIARKDSILAIEKEISGYEHPFMREVFRYMIDGVSIENLRDIFETKIDNEEKRKGAGAQIWEDAGGYAPTIGIIGAVLGLIHVMGNLTNTAALGQGIAVAFIATVYGIGSANLIFLPLAARLKRSATQEAETKEMVLDGAISILNGLNPYLIEEKMTSYIDEDIETVS